MMKWSGACHLNKLKNKLHQIRMKTAVTGISLGTGETVETGLFA